MSKVSEQLTETEEEKEIQIYTLTYEREHFTDVHPYYEMSQSGEVQEVLQVGDRGSKIVRTVMSEPIVKFIEDKAIDKFAAELKQAFKDELPKEYDEWDSYFALDDIDMWIDVVSKTMKGED